MQTSNHQHNSLSHHSSDGHPSSGSGGDVTHTSFDDSVRDGDVSGDEDENMEICVVDEKPDSRPPSPLTSCPVPVADDYSSGKEIYRI